MDFRRLHTHIVRLIIAVTHIVRRLHTHIVRHYNIFFLSKLRSQQIQQKYVPFPPTPEQVWALISAASVVLEFGARFATTSCVLAWATQNSGTVVAVDPDPAAQSIALQNRRVHKCNFHHVQGTVTSTFGGGFDFRGGDYASRTSSEKADRAPRGTFSPNFHWREIEEKIFRTKKFNTLLIDCEGCIDAVFAVGGAGGGRSDAAPERGARVWSQEQLLASIRMRHINKAVGVGSPGDEQDGRQENSREQVHPSAGGQHQAEQQAQPSEKEVDLLDQVSMILMEEDQEWEIRGGKGYMGWHAEFRRRGFTRVWWSHDTYCPKDCQWSRVMRHSAWVKLATAEGRALLREAGWELGGEKGEGEINLCEEFFREWKFVDHSELHCVDAAKEPDPPAARCPPWKRSGEREPAGCEARNPDFPQ